MKDDQEIDESPETFGELLKRLRTRKNWGQLRLARLLNPPRDNTFVSQLENGHKKIRHPLTAGDLCELALALEVRPEKLIVPYIRDYGLIVLDFRNHRIEDELLDLAKVIMAIQIAPGVTGDYVRRFGKNKKRPGQEPGQECDGGEDSAGG